VIDRLDRAATFAGRCIVTFAVLWLGWSFARTAETPGLAIAVCLATAYLALVAWLITDRGES
jgi:hypothetical protein